jgi:hypothetical protein
LDDRGKELLYQIKRWETCQGIKKLPEMLNELQKSLEYDSSERILSDPGREDAASSPPASQNPVASEEEKKIRKNWKEWKKVLGSILHSGILLYVVDDQSSISSLQLDSRQSLPSGNRWGDRISFRLEDFSITGFPQLKQLCQEGTQSLKNDIMNQSLPHSN